MRPTYVLTSDGDYLVQLPADNPWGFVLADDELTWPGGFGIATSWRVVPLEQVPKEIRERLDFLIQEVEAD